ncbi:MAG: DUF2249 domain-containing protein [Demequina sp.]|nr:DUF2249 domain-containing protein [Demequina sp.]
MPAMTTIPDLASLVQVQDEATVSRTVLKNDGARIVLFGFAAGQVLTEHTAAMPVLLLAVEGEFLITADGRTDRLLPGDVIHFDTRLPHAVEAVTDAKLALIMIDARIQPTLPNAGGARTNLLAEETTCECGHDDGSEPHIDARTLPGLIRHPAIIGAFESLPPGGSLVVIAGHLPRHLLDELAERTEFGYEVLQEGPDAWKVRLTKPAA